MQHAASRSISRGLTETRSAALRRLPSDDKTSGLSIWLSYVMQTDRGPTASICGSIREPAPQSYFLELGLRRSMESRRARCQQATRV